MKLFSLALFLASSLSALAGIIADTVLVSADDIQAGKAPLSCTLAPEGPSTVRAKIALKEPFGVPGTFASIEFRIMPEKIDYSTLSATVWDLKRIERRGHTRGKSLEFQLGNDEIHKVSSGRELMDRRAGWHVCFTQRLYALARFPGEVAGRRGTTTGRGIVTLDRVAADDRAANREANRKGRNLRR